jgi:MGT family glycosyltransferase
MRVVCATLPGPGHGFPMLAVARALAQRGHRVTLVSGEAHAAEARAAGASFALLPRVEGSPLHALRPYDDAARQAEALLPLLERLRPDAVVVDVITVGAALAAEAAGVPYATLVVHPLHTPSRTLPPFGYGRAPGRWPATRLRDAWMRRENRRDLERARRDLNRARRRLGLPPTERLDGGLSDRLVLVATLPSLEIPRPDWPPQAHVVGPCLWEPPGPGFDPGGALGGAGPLVLVAASTAYDGDRLLDPALEALRRLGLRGVVSPGAAPLPEPLPPGVVAAPGVPHRALLPHVAVALTNGGHGTVVRALAQGVPLVVVPGHGDQQENAHRVARAGAGISVRFPSAGRVARALARVLDDPRFRRAAERVAREAAAWPGPSRAAALVEEVLGGASGGRTPNATEGGQVPAPLPNGGS